MRNMKSALFSLVLVTVMVAPTNASALVKGRAESVGGHLPKAVRIKLFRQLPIYVKKDTYLKNGEIYTSNPKLIEVINKLNKDGSGALKSLAGDEQARKNLTDDQLSRLENWRKASKEVKIGLEVAYALNGDQGVKNDGSMGGGPTSTKRLEDFDARYDNELSKANVLIDSDGKEKEAPVNQTILGRLEIMSTGDGRMGTVPPQTRKKAADLLAKRYADIIKASDGKPETLNDIRKNAVKEMAYIEKMLSRMAKGAFGPVVNGGQGLHATVASDGSIIPSAVAGKPAGESTQVSKIMREVAIAELMGHLEVAGKEALSKDQLEAIERFDDLIFKQKDKTAIKAMMELSRMYNEIAVEKGGNHEK